MYRLIDFLKLEQSNTDNLYVQLSTGLVNKRKAKYIVFEEKLNSCLINYKFEEVLSFLKFVSYIIEFKKNEM